MLKKEGDKHKSKYKTTYSESLGREPEKEIYLQTALRMGTKHSSV